MRNLDYAILAISKRLDNSDPELTLEERAILKNGDGAR
jgi:hypothetical protein